MATQPIDDNRPDVRKSTRHSLNIKGSARIAVGIDIIDASATGVKARLSVPLPIGTLINIGLPGNNKRHARVVWSEGDITGCEFVQPLDSYDLVTLLEGPKAQND